MKSLRPVCDRHDVFFSLTSLFFCGSCFFGAFVMSLTEWDAKDEDEEDKKQWEDDWEDEESDDFANQLR